MKKKLIVGTGLGALLLAGGIALAAPEGGMGHKGMRHGGGMYGADANKDGTLTRAELTAHLDARFAKRDANGDGQITKEEREAQHKARMDEHFKRLDADGNGQVSRAEFDAAREQRHAKMAGGKAGHGDKMGRRGGGHRGMADANGDGTLTKAEYAQRFVTMFDRADANKDGQVTKEEREAMRAAWKAKHGGKQ